LREIFELEGARLRPARGSHIIFAPNRIPLKAAVTIASPDDGRPVFLVPHPEGVLMGTTDIYHDGSLDDPRISREELEYLLRAVQTEFPSLNITQADIVGSFAGVRPILYSQADKPSEASREEDIWEEKGMLSVAGGKLTTWRFTAEEAVNEAVKRLPESRTRSIALCHTKGTPLVDLAPVDLEERLRQTYSLSPEVARGMTRRLRNAAWWAPRLARRRRSEAFVSLAFWAPQMARNRKELTPLIDGTDLTAAGVRAHLNFGAVLKLEDLLLRRVRVGLWNPTLARELAPKLRPFFEQELGWKRARWEKESEDFHEALQAWSPEGVR
jgi:glycerol-3-phosphate dehydrogenase